MEAFRMVDSEKYPSVGLFLREHVEMQFADLRLMLQMPLGNEQGPGCNYASTAVLMNLISGFSVCLYDASKAALKDRRNRGPRFKALLTKYYPWEGEKLGQEEGSELLYNMVRNPLAHSLGINADMYDEVAEESDVEEWTGIAKRSMNLAEIATLESSSVRPTWLGEGRFTWFERTLASGETGKFLSVPCLYWGVWRTLERLCSDTTQMDKANTLLGSLEFRRV